MYEQLVKENLSRGHGFLFDRCEYALSIGQNKNDKIGSHREFTSINLSNNKSQRKKWPLLCKLHWAQIKLKTFLNN